MLPEDTEDGKRGMFLWVKVSTNITTSAHAHRHTVDDEIINENFLIGNQRVITTEIVIILEIAFLCRTFDHFLPKSNFYDIFLSSYCLDVWDA